MGCENENLHHYCACHSFSVTREIVHLLGPFPPLISSKCALAGSGHCLYHTKLLSISDLEMAPK
jgi:hypothetical protein